jgi:amidase
MTADVKDQSPQTEASTPVKGSADSDRLDAVALAELVRTKQASPEELLEAAIARAEAANPVYNFMAQKHYDYARAAVAKGLPDGPFRGVPFLLKDISVFIEGELTGAASRFYTKPATYTSELVKRYERAGLVIFGKTTTPELGCTATTESRLNGQTSNPWNRAHSVGGSSGGAVAAVAAGVIPAAHAADGGGSIRIPASTCGLFGLKPSRGRMPSGPMKTETWGGLAIPHVVSWSVRDSAAMLDATHGSELGSSYTAPAPERPFLEEVRRDPGKLRIAYNTVPLPGTPVDPECVEAVHATARLCASLGHHVEEAAPKLDADGLARATSAITFSHLNAELKRQAAATGIEPGPDVLEKMTLIFNGWGAEVSGADYVAANEFVQRTAITIAQFMQNYDVLLSPTLANLPLPLGVLSLSAENTDAYFETLYKYVPFTSIYNVTGQPAMSVPLAMSRSGLPIGVHFASRYGDEATLYRLAGQLETAAPWTDKRPY